MPASRFDFVNVRGERLAGLLDEPPHTVRAYALFAHCFTCGKDVSAARRIADGLKKLGIGVLRFDFTGLGSSEGEFANTTFSSNVTDLIAAADALRIQKQAPTILIGHSLGGAAVIAAAASVPEARAVVTIAAPSDPAHVLGLFKGRLPEFAGRDEIDVALRGRSFRIRRSFVDDVAQQKLREKIAQLHKALLIFHSPTDEAVGINNASEIFLAAKHPKSFVALPGADHLLGRSNDAAYVANIIGAWAERYLDEAHELAPSAGSGEVIVSETRRGRFQQEIMVRGHHLLADEPRDVGGLDSGPGPYDFLLAALGACTAMTLRLYAEGKRLPLDHVTVRLSHSKIYAADCESCETKEGMIDQIDRAITLSGHLDDEVRKRLFEIADKCPVHRTLRSEIEIRTTERR